MIAPAALLVLLVELGGVLLVLVAVLVEVRRIRRRLAAPSAQTWPPPHGGMHLRRR